MPSSQKSLFRSASSHSASLTSLVESRQSMTPQSPLSTSQAPKSISISRDENTLVWRHPDHTRWYRRILDWVLGRRKVTMAIPEMEGANGCNRAEDGRIPSHLSMTSRLSFFNDRMLGPERKLSCKT